MNIVIALLFIVFSISVFAQSGMNDPVPADAPYRNASLPIDERVDAGVSFVMMAYNTLDGIPCASNAWLISGILKGQCGLEGYVSTDGSSAEDIRLRSTLRVE